MQRYNPATIWPVPEAFRSIYSHAVEISGPGKLLFVSGQIGVALDGSVSKQFDAQCHQAMANVEALLAEADLPLKSLLRVTYFLTNPDDLPALGSIRSERWGQTEPPAVTTLVVAALARPDLLVEIEVTAGSEVRPSR